MTFDKTKNDLKTKKVVIASAMVALALATTGATVFVLSNINSKDDEANEISSPEGLPTGSSPIQYDENGNNDEDVNDDSSELNDETKKESIKEEDLPDTLPKTTKDDYKQSEVAFEKKVTTTEKISFSTTTTNEANLPRGKVVVSQQGVDGAKKITYLVKYNSKGESLAIEKLSEEVTKNPVTQIKKVGTSDYNLNDNLVVSTFASGICLPEDADAGGCKRASESYQFATAFELSNVHYVTQIQADDGTKTVFQKVLDGKFSYGGKNWIYETRYLKQTNVLSESFCKTYGFACGKW